MKKQVERWIEGKEVRMDESHMKRKMDGCWRNG